MNKRGNADVSCRHERHFVAGRFLASLWGPNSRASTRPWLESSITFSTQESGSFTNYLNVYDLKKIFFGSASSLSPAPRRFAGFFPELCVIPTWGKEADSDRKPNLLEETTL